MLFCESDQSQVRQIFDEEWCEDLEGEVGCFPNVDVKHMHQNIVEFTVSSFLHNHLDHGLQLLNIQLIVVVAVEHVVDLSELSPEIFAQSAVNLLHNFLLDGFKMNRFHDMLFNEGEVLLIGDVTVFVCVGMLEDCPCSLLINLHMKE